MNKHPKRFNTTKAKTLKKKGISSRKHAYLKNLGFRKIFSKGKTGASPNAKDDQSIYEIKDTKTIRTNLKEGVTLEKAEDISVCSQIPDLTDEDMVSRKTTAWHKYFLYV